MNAAILVVALAAVAAPDSGEWQGLGHNGNQTFYFEGHGKVSVPSANPPVACRPYQLAGGCVAHFGTKIVYASRSERGEGADADRWVTYRLMSLSADCTSGDFHLESMTTFFDRGASRVTAGGDAPQLLSHADIADFIAEAKQIICGPVLEAVVIMARQAADGAIASGTPLKPEAVLRTLKPDGASTPYTVSMGAADRTYSVTVEGKPVDGHMADVAAYEVACELRREGDFQHAEVILRPVAERGLAYAQYCLGSMYARGEGLQQDDVEALKWFRKAAEQQDADAELQMSFAYDAGKGIAKDAGESMRWLMLSAGHGSADAQLLLGASYDGGLGVKQDDADAVHWYRLAADQDNHPAQYYLGKMYMSGRGVDRNDTEAIKLWTRAAEGGYDNAQFILGMMYVRGEGVARDFNAAVEWLRRAAKQGQGAAQIALGARYLQGQGVHKDVQRAYMWFNIAVGNASASDDDNHQLAIRDRELARAKLSMDEMSKAITMATQCVAQQYKDCD